MSHRVIRVLSSPIYSVFWITFVAYRHEVMVAIVPRIKYENGGFPGSYEDQKIAAKEFSEHLRSGAWQTQGKECRMRAFIVHDVHTGLVSEQY